MSTITIQKISITDLATDAIVNAANDGLWAGSGVCGAIFRAAGHDQLQAACNAIGHCDTGSAVITPGFRLKAKYIIHAVGPRWSGGNHKEPQLLYSAYTKSLALATEKGCHSISFPLISAGIYGYPLEEHGVRRCKPAETTSRRIRMFLSTWYSPCWMTESWRRDRDSLLKSRRS